ncbi:MAG: DUF4936 family protein [Pseudomonadota bacterium]|nr:DUF4936 family protein [Pseudomonadota bacterium]
MAGRELFVWYRVRRGCMAEARAAVAAMQRSLAAAWPGLQARLLIRDDGDSPTWLETYAHGASGATEDGGIDAGIEAAIAAAADPLAALIDGARRVEAFDVAP